MSYSVLELKEFDEKAYLGKPLPHVAAVAIKTKNNQVHVLAGHGVGHDYLRNQMQLINRVPKVLDLPHGFILAGGIYVDRKVAMEAAYQNQQLNQRGSDGYKVGRRELYSYDIEYWGPNGHQPN